MTPNESARISGRADSAATAASAGGQEEQPWLVKSSTTWTGDGWAKAGAASAKARINPLRLLIAVSL